MITIDELIQQGEDITPQIKIIPPSFDVIRIGDVYGVEKTEEYENWKANVKRFIRVNYPNDKSVMEFEKVSSNKLSPTNHKKLLAIIKAIKDIPQPNTASNDSINKNREIIINNNNINQIQNMELKNEINIIFTQCIKEELTGRQLKEINEIIELHKNEPEKAKPKIIEKLKSFGGNLLSSIIANIITNPNIYSNFL